MQATTMNTSLSLNHLLERFPRWAQRPKKMSERLSTYARALTALS